MTRYFFEFTGPGRQFANPNGVVPDAVNGFGGAGGALTVTGTSLFLTVPASIASGTYQVRVIPLSASGQFIGSFSNAVPVRIP